MDIGQIIKKKVLLLCNFVFYFKKSFDLGKRGCGFLLRNRPNAMIVSCYIPYRKVVGRETDR